MSGPDVESTDDQLVDLARAGSAAAFAVLVGRYQAEVYNLAFRLTESRDLAAEVAQETWIRAWRGMSRFRGDAAFTTWIYRITANTASTWRVRSRQKATVDLAEIGEPEVVDGSQIPEQFAENWELRRRLRRGLATLSPALRTVVVLKDVYGWSHREIAEALGISVAATKVRLHRAHQRLQRCLREEPS